MSRTRQIYTCAVLSERLQTLVAELREVEKLRSKLRHIGARATGRRRRTKRAAEQEPFRDPAGSEDRPALASRGDGGPATCRQPARPACLTTFELTRWRDRPSIQDRAVTLTFVRRCTSEHSNKSIAFPKLNVVLAMHLLGSTPRRLLVNAVELCRADHWSGAVHHKRFVPHDAIRSQRRPSS